MNAIPAFRDCFLGRIIQLNSYTLKRGLSVTTKHFDWREGMEFTNKPEDSRALPTGGSGMLPPEMLAGRVQRASDRRSISAAVPRYIQVTDSLLGGDPPVKQRRAY